ncbi:MAG: D-alanyl-D-alanine carboxypeptidase [Armatimonadetes bacterium]|nr:D-alanyl-D-alanine carboxypeptidase [Armatimonadota bacterium]
MFWPVQQVDTDALNKILADPALQGAQIGVCVTSSGGEVLFERNKDVRFVPASNQKVLTCLTAFGVFGTKERFSTSFWRTKKRLEVSASGDATLTLADLRGVRKRLNLDAHLPVCIHGPYRQSLGPGWEWDDLAWYYAATTAPLTFDDGAFEVWAEGGRVAPLPAELGVRVVRHPGNGAVKVTFDREHEVLTVTGRLPSGRTRLERIAQANPTLAAAHALGGDPVWSDHPLPSGPPDVVIVGKELATVAKECLEESDNAIAERLMALAVTKSGTLSKPLYDVAPGFVHDWLVAHAGLASDSFRAVDGSGLSRHNQVAPSALCKALNWAQSQPFADVWRDCLPAGGEGTLRSRLKDSTFVGKTGTMDAVVCLSGYLTTKSGNRLTVSFLVNNNLAPASAVREVQDRFVRALEKGS